LNARYQDFDEDEDLPLLFICSSPASLQAAIMWYHNAIDSPWRHKNENVAPLTFITTLDDYNKMISGWCFIIVKGDMKI
jgi:hypothetical protein